MFTADELRDELAPKDHDAHDALHYLVPMELVHKVRRSYFATRMAVAQDDVAI